MAMTIELNRTEIYNEEFLPQSHKALESYGLARSHEQLDLLYLYYVHQSWQEGDLR